MCIPLVLWFSIIDKVLGISHFLDRVQEKEGTVNTGHVYKALLEQCSKELRVFIPTRTKDSLNLRDRISISRAVSTNAWTESPGAS